MNGLVVRKVDVFDLIVGNFDEHAFDDDYQSGHALPLAYFSVRAERQRQQRSRRRLHVCVGKVWQ